MKWKKLRNKAAAAAIIATNISCTMLSPVMAAPPSVATDEALYINLDYYGNQVNSSVVKGCNLNGIRAFTDYGNYTDVTNMSNYAEPVISEDGVTWELPADSKERFYYECQLENESIELSWTFDISYKLNGVPVEAQKLLGADGLIEIDVECSFNDKAKDYYKNNMILQVGTLVDMEDVRNVEAPGAQIQSMGTYKIILFAGVPGEENNFHIEISSSDFESPGLIMMMVPGTLDQMSEIKEIKNVKDTFYDSTDELIDGINELLTRLDGMTSGMEQAKKGLAELQKARAELDSQKDKLASSSDATLDELDALSINISELAPDINNSKATLDEINEDMNRMVETLRGSSGHFFELSSKLSDLEESLESIERSDFTSSTTNEIEDQIETIEGILNEMGAGLDSIKALQEKGADASTIDSYISDLQKNAASLLDELEGVVGVNQVKDIRDKVTALDSTNFGDSYKELTRLSKQYQEIIKKAKKVIANARSANRKAVNTLQHGEDATTEISELMADMDGLIGNVNELNRTINDNKESFDSMLDNAQVVSESLSTSVNTTVIFLRDVQETLRNNRSTLEEGTKNTLDGLIDIMEKTVEISPTNGKLQEANNSMRDSIKSEIDKIGDDTNLLNLDSEHRKISFTSDKNPEPSSIQIILRTEEISEEKINENAEDLEPVQQDDGVWARIVRVFKKIWEGIFGIFN